MTWTDDDPFVGEADARGYVDSGTYRALVMQDYGKGKWLGTVDLFLIDHHYVATCRACVDRTEAKLWCEASLLQLQHIADRLGELRQ